MRGHHMPATLRLSDSEQELIRKKAVEINKLLVAKGHQPVRDSELVHKILEKTISYATVGRDGQITVEF